MRTLRMALVGGFTGLLMAGNVATLHAAPLPTHVASMKSMVADNSIQIRWGGWRISWCPNRRRDREQRIWRLVRRRRLSRPVITAATIPAIATIRHTSTMVGKQSKSLGPRASTDLMDTAAGPGAIGKRAGLARIQHSPSTFGVLIIVL
jgi:hypothetical protein